MNIIVEGRELDDQQMNCITNVYHNHLVVAGAGTGKTTTIIGKIKHLLKINYCKPTEILVLSFTNASASEMKDRIYAETGEKIHASTFHSLGYEIVKSVSGKNIKISKLSLEEFIFNNLLEEEKYFAHEIHNIISLARTNNICLDNLSTEKLGNDEITILNLAKNISTKYEEYLRDHNEIDFSDMINLATKYISECKYLHHFKYVIVDEYQDISMARFELLKVMRTTLNYDLFCVGDDWQAIYKFAGSEVDLILNFEKYWGESVISKIETTYRFSKSLVEASGKFVMENYFQIPKNIRGIPDDYVPVLRTDGSSKKLFGKEIHRPDFAIEEICADAVKDTLLLAKRIILNLPENSTVFFIGRYTFDKSHLFGFSLTERPDIKYEFLTAHKSKGLQADYVFLINLKRGRMGFPSKIESTNLIKLLHGKTEKYPYAEERRLFYVAMTRAKKKCFLLTTHGHKSEFVLEMEDLLYRKLKITNFGLLED